MLVCLVGLLFCLFYSLCWCWILDLTFVISWLALFGLCILLDGFFRIWLRLVGFALVVVCL